MSTDLVRIWRHTDMSNKVACLSERLLLGHITHDPSVKVHARLCLNVVDSNLKDTPSFTEKKKKKLIVSTAVISGAQLNYISNLYHCICTKPLLQVKFTYLKVYRQKSLWENLRLLSNSVCLVIYCYQGIKKDICKQVTMTSGLKHIFYTIFYKHISFIHKPTCPVAPGDTVFSFFTNCKEDKC